MVRRTRAVGQLASLALMALCMGIVPLQQAAHAAPPVTTWTTAMAQPICNPAPSTKGTTVYALANHSHIYRSQGGGGSWQEVSNGFPVQNSVYTLALGSVNSDVFYAGTTAGEFYKTFNGGTHWFSANDESIATTFVYAMVVDPHDNRRVYAGGDNSVYRSLDGGLTWEEGNIGIPSFTVLSMALDPTNPNVVYVGTDTNGIFRSDSDMVNWTSVSNGLPTDSAVNALVTDPSQPGTIYAGTDDGLFKTTNGGITWSFIDGGLPAGQPIRTVTLSPHNSQVIYAGTAVGLYVSTQAGAGWMPVHGNLGKTSISSLAVDPQNPNTVYAASGPFILRTIDGGQTWASVNAGMNAQGISFLAVFHPTLTPTSPCLPPPGKGGWAFYPQTGHILAPPFLSYYNANGGATVFGYPRTEQIIENGVLVQYFENGRLEVRGKSVIVSDSGLSLRKPYAVAPIHTGTPQHPFFRLGDHNISDLFLRYYRHHGGAAVLGMPTSEEIFEPNNDGTGRSFNLQWFTKARLEYHPEMPGATVVQFGKLGDELLRSRGWL